MSGVVKSMDSAMRSMNLEKVGHLLSYSLTTFDEMLIEGETAFFSLGFWAKIMKNILQYFQIFLEPGQHKKNLLILIFSEIFE